MGSKILLKYLEKSNKLEFVTVKENPISKDNLIKEMLNVLTSKDIIIFSKVFRLDEETVKFLPRVANIVIKLYDTISKTAIDRYEPRKVQSCTYRVTDLDDIALQLTFNVNGFRIDTTKLESCKYMGNSGIQIETLTENEVAISSKMNGDVTIIERSIIIDLLKVCFLYVMKHPVFYLDDIKEFVTPYHLKDYYPYDDEVHGIINQNIKNIK